eukprot:TRINITY_DN14510_c1_g1_i1.p1 TRINITY_DN14510_c1_g1~~TRINITY_DN14510_c1_g1_i1.p1  ORF type:complete len:455 (+),score=112.35 TRINITY_DN14510_c1_g1_i1:67-1431(+)
MKDMLSTLLDPAVKQESYEEFLSKFEHGVVPTVAKPDQEKEDQKVREVLQQLQAASRAVAVQKEELPVVEKKPTEDNTDNISELSRKTDSTISAGPGSTVSILDNPELQKNVQFDNFVDGFSDSLHPSDISDAESYEWVHVAGKDESATNQKTATPPNTPALTDAALLKLRNQQEKESSLQASRVAKPVAGPELPPDMKARIEEGKRDAANRNQLSKFGKIGPSLPPGWTVDINTLKSRPPGAESERVEDAFTEEGKRDAANRNQLSKFGKIGPSLPPGWTVDINTLKSRPPGAESERVEDAFTEEDAQRLHHDLLSNPTDSNIIATDADTIVSEAELLRGSPNPTAVKAGNLIPPSKDPAITSELFGSLHTPQKPAPHEESAFTAPPQPPTTGGSQRATQFPPQAASSPHTDKPEVWTEEIESFNLDPDFNYDDIKTLKRKPRNPFEVGEDGH